VQLLIAFANSVDADEGTDDLTTPRELTSWLSSHGLADSQLRASKAELALARELRSSLHDAFVGNHDRSGAGGAVGLAHLETVAAELPLRVGSGTAHPELRPVEGGVRGALSLLLVAVSDCVADDTWRRLKICSDDACQWAYFDASKNRSRTWCEWGCGNRQKTRNYRARQRAALVATTG
jgi:predicted RNA-binding Zn ribbon-like protein